MRHLALGCQWLRGPLVGLFLLALAALSEISVPAQERSASSKAGQEVALRAARSLYEGITYKELSNGLKVYLKPVPGSQLVTTMVAYKVGSADEDLDSTGLSHYLEHLMFKGTGKLKPGDIDRITLQNGGANNAYTTEDYTIYHFDFAADRWLTALDIEADRMRNLKIDKEHEFDKEKGAIIQELNRNEDMPWDLEYKAIVPILFGRKSPYGHPVIGEREHVYAATEEIIKAHYDKWYHPNNASLVVCGGIDPDKALAEIEKRFGPIPSGKLPPRKEVPQHKPQRPARLHFPSKFEVSRMIMGFNTIDTKDPDFHALELLQTVLTGGKTGRLYKELVEGKGVAGLVSSTNSAGRYPGWFAIQVQLLQGKDRKTAEDLVVAQLERLHNELLKPEELERAKQNVLTEVIFGRETVHNLADSIARGVTTNDLNFLKNYLPNIMKVTAEDLRRVAKKYLDPKQRVVVWSESKAAPAGEGGGQSLAPGVSPATAAASIKGLPPLARHYRSGRQAGGSGPGNFSLQDSRRFTLPNGLTLVLLENRRLPIIAAQASVRNISLHEPADKAGVATLTGYLLDEGTKKHKGSEIAEMIENVGGYLTVSSSGVGVKVLSPDRELGLGLLFECLSQPNFPAEAFQFKQARLLSEIVDAETQPETKAEMVFRETIYGNHPYGRPALGRKEIVEKLTPQDCAAFHGKVFVPNNTVVAIVGDFDTLKVVEEIKRLTGDWKKADLAEPKAPEVVKPKEFAERFLTMPEAAQLHFYMGHVGVRRNNPDYYKLLVMDYILGTGPGFTDRLSARLRDRDGLAYTVSANITSSSTEEPGLFTCYIGTAPEQLQNVKAVFLDEIKRLREEKPKAEEVEDVKKYLLGSLPFQLASNDRIATLLTYIERYQLGKSYVDDYKKAIQAVTPEDVQEVARKYITPEHMVLVASGAIDATGKPLPPPPGP